MSRPVITCQSWQYSRRKESRQTRILRLEKIAKREIRPEDCGSGSAPLGAGPTERPGLFLADASAGSIRWLTDGLASRPRRAGELLLPRCDQA